MRNARTRDSYPADWFIEDDEPVAQSPAHQRREFRLQSKLLAWQQRAGQRNLGFGAQGAEGDLKPQMIKLLVGCEMACRWDPKHPKVGVDPDVYVVVEPPPDPKTGQVWSLRTWKEGHSPPILAIEIVSNRRPQKDYRDSPEKHDLLGTFELWIFDPNLEGYTDQQPPVLLQIFQRETNHRLVQVYAGAGPFRSDALDAWVMVKDKELVIANDPEGLDPWPTLEEAERAVAQQERAAKEQERAAKEQERAAKEQERAAKEQERAAKEQERAAKEAALARVAELEALLAKKSTKT
jgi:hypothetical protein